MPCEVMLISLYFPPQTSQFFRRRGAGQVLVRWSLMRSSELARCPPGDCQVRPLGRLLELLTPAAVLETARGIILLCGRPDGASWYTGHLQRLAGRSLASSVARSSAPAARTSSLSASGPSSLAAASGSSHHPHRRLRLAGWTPVCGCAGTFACG